MKKLFLVGLILILLASCVTTGTRNSYSEEEKREALELLASDMLSSRERDSRIDTSFFEELLPESYTAYNGYCPMYQSLSSEYTSELSELLSPLLYDIYPVLVEAFYEVISSDDLDTMIESPEGLTDALQSQAAREIYSLLMEEAGSLSVELDEAFSESYEIFMSVRASYLNLASVGENVILPEPKAIGVDMLAFAVEDALFSMMAEDEVELKSRIPESPDSLYSVFWEDSI